MKALLATLRIDLAILRGLLRGGFVNSAGLGFAAYIVAICYPAMRATPAMLESVRAGETTMANVGESSLHIAVPALLLGLALFARHGIVTVLTRFQGALMFLWIFSCLVLLFTVLLGDYPDSISQVTQYALTATGFVLCIAFWQAPPRAIDNALAMAVVALGGSLVAAAMLQGFHDYRWVGLIHPNHYARYAYMTLVLHSVLTRQVSLVMLLPCLAATYMVSARTVMIGTVLFYAGYLACTMRGVPADPRRRMPLANALCAVLLGTPAVLMGLVMTLDVGRLFDRLTNDLALFDPDRGLSSGFTGRSDSWNAFFDAMEKFVFFGYGFRSSRYNLHSVHSGVLSYFMDFGMLLGGLLLLAVLARTIQLIWTGARLPERRGLICGLGLATTLLIQCFEPDNFNIGFIGAFFFMLILGYARPPVRGAARALVWRALPPRPAPPARPMPANVIPFRQPQWRHLRPPGRAPIWPAAPRSVAKLFNTNDRVTS
ncbi:hypothetical protein [Bradyrhizobium sp. 2TAF24]|uniref:hypothetical protein n=1 Tax=Bradyrhizobium sp. 2TAF24 TaxID=3233011 RepID=UPI003F91C35C